jgi:phosphatidate cytidylyltransferase
MLSRRIATTALFLPILILGLGTEMPGRWILAVLVACCSVWGLSEFFDMAAKRGMAPSRGWIYLAAAGSAFLVHLCGAWGLPYRWVLAWVFLAFLLSTSGSILAGRIEGSMLSLCGGLAGFGYVVAPLLLALVLRLSEHGPWFLGLVILVTWASDTGAYFGGRAFGRHKLAPTISPGKTWEGSLSGIVFTAGLIGLAGGLQLAFEKRWGYSPHFFWTPGEAEDVLRLTLLAAVLVVTGTIGDLAESMLKRDTGVKDSGSPLTGHGGFLDITDSLLVNLPVMFLYALLFEGLTLRI